MQEKTAGIREALFDTLDFDRMRENADFKEADVRSLIIEPVLKELGFTHTTILRNKTLLHPLLKTGVSKRPITLIPDYLLKVEDSFGWVLDAKSPSVAVLDVDAIEQVYSYAVHREIRSVYFALCNGVEFSLFRTSSPDSPILYFRISEIDGYWEELRRLLSPASFQTGKKFEYEREAGGGGVKDFDYASRPLLKEIALKRRAVRRHFGVHPYFTKQSWNVVSKYIENYTQAGDLVLDPFGGSGVSAIEALMLKRKAINIDINPFAVFLTEALAAPVNLSMFSKSYESIRKEYLSKEPKTKKAVKEAL